MVSRIDWALVSTSARGPTRALKSPNKTTGPKLLYSSRSSLSLSKAASFASVRDISLLASLAHTLLESPCMYAPPSTICPLLVSSCTHVACLVCFSSLLERCSLTSTQMPSPRPPPLIPCELVTL